MQTKKFNVDQMYSAYFTLVIELRLEHAMIADKRKMLNYHLDSCNFLKVVKISGNNFPIIINA